MPLSFSNLEINPKDLPHAEELTLQPLEPNYKKVLMLQTILLWCIPLILGLMFLVSDSPLWLGASITLLSIIMMVLNMLWLGKAYRFRGYALREKDITYRSGIIFTKILTVPLSRVQQVSVKRNPMDRLFGLHSVLIADASQMSGMMKIPGLTEERAEQIKSYIIAAIRERKDEPSEEI